MKSLSYLNNTSVLILVHFYYCAITTSSYLNLIILMNRLIFFILFIGIISLSNE